jgi:hypothetical protein
MTPMAACSRARGGAGSAARVAADQPHAFRLCRAATRTTGLLPGGTVVGLLARLRADRLGARRRREIRKRETDERLETRIETAEHALITEGVRPSAFIERVVTAAHGDERDE